MHVVHPLKPIYDRNSKVLILGSIPSVKSRELGFYYAHPQNRFWKILAKIYNEPIATTIEARKKFLLKHHIALFDVIQSCDIISSSDSTIKNPIPNDFTPILETANIKAIFTTGRKAYQLYNKYCYSKTGISAKILPSTSPANCRKGIEEELLLAYSQIKKYTD